MSSFLGYWRHLLLLFIVLGSLAFMLSRAPFGQDLKYHDFADKRALVGVPNCFDVISNIPFLLIGIAGTVLCIADTRMGLRSAWLTFFLGVALVSAGSAYYHVDPNNASLVWDRLPMTIGFMSLFVALLGEYVAARLGQYLLVPAVLLGVLSVLYWQQFDDLRFYFWIQLIPLLTIPVVMLLFRSGYSHQWALVMALALYAAAKVSEIYDKDLFVLTRNFLSGHTLKHLLAASACLVVLVMLKSRKLRSAHGQTFLTTVAPSIRGPGST